MSRLADHLTPTEPPTEPAGEWYVVRTNPNCEERAQKGIEALGVEVFVPRESHFAIRSRRRVRVTYPLFRRYLFVRLDLAKQGTHAIRHTHGVHSMLTSAGGDAKLATIPARVVDLFRRAEKAGEFDRTIEGATFRVGSNARIEEGPFVGLVGEVFKADHKDRVIVLLNLLNRRVEVAVPSRNLSAA